MRSKSVVLFLNTLRSVLFIIMFLMMDGSYISGGRDLLTSSNLSNAIMDVDVGYNNLFYIVGLLVTAMYILGLNYYFNGFHSVYAVKRGRQYFYRKMVSCILMDSFFISLEYVGSTVVVCTFAFRFSVLLESGFYLCCLLYLLMLFFYFALVGISTVVIRILVNFKKIYLLLSSVLFFGLAGLDVFQIEISPVYFCSFITEWFISGTFDAMNYAVCAVKCILSVAAIYILGNILILRKDILFDEES